MMGGRRRDTVDIRKTIIAAVLVFANVITPALALRDYKSLKGIKEFAVVVASIEILKLKKMD